MIISVMRPYRAYTPAQAFLLPPSLTDLLSPEDPVFFLRQVLGGQLDLSAFHEVYRCERGQPPYHPALMVGIYFYGAMRRIYSSRKLADACHRDIGFMVLSGGATPDYHTIGEFRQRFTREIAGLFVQVLGLCQEAGLVRLGHISLDGTKLRANASRHKAMSYGRGTRGGAAPAARRGHPPGPGRGRRARAGRRRLELARRRQGDRREAAEDQGRQGPAG